MKKILVTFAFLLTLMPVVAKFSYSEFVTISFYSGGIKYTIDSDSTVKLVKYDEGKKYTGDIVIPSTVVYAEDSFIVKKIEGSSFSSCYGLKSIVLPPTIKLIGDDTFANCTSLTSITLPPTITSIGEYAFSSCTSLTSITLPPSITSIGLGAFWECSALTTIDIPKNVRSIAGGTFIYCTKLTNVTMPSSVCSIGEGAFEGCENLTSIVIPQTVTYIGGNCFKNCTKLKTIDNLSSTKEIYQDTFYGCSSLTSINIPSSVTSIRMNAFGECTSLTSITIPMNVNIIEESAFYYCSGLKEIYCKMVKPTSGYNDYIFYAENKSTCKLYVPKGSSTLYSQEYVWRGFKNIIEVDYTAVNNVDISEVAVCTYQQDIVVKGAKPGESVAVYTVSGLLVKALRADGEVRIPVASAGVYVVRVGGKVFKVVS